MQEFPAARGSAALGCLLALLVPCAAVRAGDGPGEPALRPGTPLTFALALESARAHPVDLQAGDLLRISVRNEGPETTLTLTDPGGAVLARRAPSTEAFSGYRLVAVAEAAGRYMLEVRSGAEGRAGRYVLSMEEPRPATEADRALAAGEALLAEAAALFEAEGSGARDAALTRIAAAQARLVEAGDGAALARAAYERAQLQFEAGDPEAAASLDDALGRFRSLGDRDGEAATLTTQGEALLRKGDLDAALLLFDQAGALAEANGNLPALSVSTNYAGIALSRAGRAEKAIERFTRALALGTQTGGRRREARPLANLGLAYRNLGDLPRALEYYERSLKIWRAVGLRDEGSTALGNMGVLQTLLGDDARALALFEEALTMASGVAEVEGRLLNSIARVHLRRRDFARAVDFGRRSLERRRQVRDRAGEGATLHTLGRALDGLGDTAGARQHLADALRIEQAIGDRLLEADTLLAMATLERDHGNLREALVRAAAAVDLTERLRAAVTNPDLRASFGASEQDKYGIYVDILMRLHEQDPAAGHDAAALQASERARARVLLETLIEARADIRQGVEPALLERERALQHQLRDATRRLSRALSREGGGEEALNAQKALDHEKEEYAQVQSLIRRRSPRYAALTQPEPATLEEIRREGLDDETVLLAFHLGDERSFLWAVTREELVSHTLPGRKTIEAAARRVHELLTERQRTRGGSVLQGADNRLQVEAMRLSVLLLSELAPRLSTAWKGRRLLIVAPGALAYLPFAALPSPDAAARPLLLDHEVVSAPSASVVVALRREHAPWPAGEARVAVLADPVFDAADPRVRRAAGAAAAPVPLELGRAVRGLGRGLSRLPFSRAEADALAALVPERSLLRATDFQATRALALDGALAEFRIVHFATHGLLNSEHPDLSGLVLSLVDARGAPRDGFLRMGDVYNLRLPAGLVVLSACQTALGREIRGEGLMGLTRGFMYAGAPRVVASLWQVDDESTAELMALFYRRLLKGGQRPSAALRAAQIELSQMRRWAAPFYWAGFVLQGDWR